MDRSAGELRDLRVALGLRQDFVAMVVLGYASGNRLHDYETGRRAMPEAHRRRLARYLAKIQRAHVAALPLGEGEAAS